MIEVKNQRHVGFSVLSVIAGTCDAFLAAAVFSALSTRGHCRAESASSASPAVGGRYWLGVTRSNFIGKERLILVFHIFF